MKSGRTLQELAAEIARQATVKRDFVAPASALVMEVPGSPQAGWAAPRIKLGNGGGKGHELALNETAHDQLASKLQIPRAYYDRMRSDAPDLLAASVNRWLQTQPDKRYMVRTLDGRMRALLTERYRPLDYHGLLSAILPVIYDADCQVESCEVTETRLYVKAVSRRVSGEVNVGEYVQAGLIASNSEVGFGRVVLDPLLWKLTCKNGAIMQEYGLKKTHLGRAQSGDMDLDSAYELYSDRTRELDDSAFWNKVRDVAKATLTEVTFRKMLGKAKAAASAKITRDPVEVVEVAQKQFALNDAERGDVLRFLVEGGDLSQWGLANAVTRMSQEDAVSYDRATELERVGGQIIELAPQDWSVLASKN